MAAKEDFADLSTKLENFLNFPLYVGNSDCVKRTFAQKYWDLFGANLVAGAALLLLIS
jgi:hypothetical protein